MGSLDAVGSLLQWLSLCGVTHIDLAIQRRDTQGNQQAFLAPKTTHAQQLNPKQVLHRLAWLRAENVRGGDIYFRPFRHQHWPIVFLDDLPPSLALKIADTYRSAVMETSPGRCHLWLVLNRSLDEKGRFELQRDLVDKCKGAADPGSTSGDHWGRLPSFRNHKPGRNCWVNLLALTNTPPFQPDPLKSFSTPRGVVVHRKKRTASHQSRPDQSRLEWGWVMSCLEKDIPHHWVLDKLVQRATQRRGPKDALRYAQYTLNKART